MGLITRLVWGTSRFAIEAHSLDICERRYSVEWGLRDASFTWARLFVGRNDELLGRVCLGEEKGKVVLLDTCDFLTYAPAAPVKCGDFVLCTQLQDNGKCLTARPAMALFGTKFGGTFSAAVQKAADGKYAYGVFSADTIDRAKHLWVELSDQLLEHWSGNAELERRERITAGDVAKAQDELAHDIVRVVCRSYGVDVAVVEQLAPIMQAHDWYYNYSDDGSVWGRGDRQYKAIKAELSKLPKIVAAAFWGAFAPSDLALPAEFE